MRRTCNPEKPVRIWHGAPAGKSSARFEHSTDNREAAGSTPASRTMFSCGQVNRCHAGLISHASGVQLASPQPVLWGSRSTGGPLACNQQMRVRLPPLPPISPGRPLRSRRRSEKPDKHVRLVLLAPSVTVAEWLRRQTVDLSTRVQFPPVTPTMRASFNGENTSVLTKKCRFDSGRLFQCFVGVAQLDESAGFRSPRPLVRFQPLTPDL